MNVSSFKPRLLGSSMIIAAAIALGATVPALAADTVTQGVTEGALSASIASMSLASVSAKNVAQAATGVLALTADDSRGVNPTDSEGWNVTVLAGNFIADPDTTVINGGVDISATNFSLTSAGTPALGVGQAVNSTPGNGPEFRTTLGTLNSALKVISAGAGYGSGTYSQNLGVSLNVPAFTRQGTYLSTLVVTISTAP
jgi:hypothetical protein